MIKFLNNQRITMIFVLCMMGIMVCGTKGEAATQAEALQWVKSQVGKSIDVDGAYGAQCVDLIKAYYSYLGVSPVSGNGCDYATNSLPSGWIRLQGATPQPGDILVYSGNNSNPYGHVAIYESTYSTYHQNFSGSYVEQVTYIAYNGFSNAYWGVIRPAFSAADSTPPTISNVKITDVTKDGYTVTCTVTDNTGVTSVKFPSWNTDIHQGEDANWLVGTISGNTASVRVNTKDLKSGAIEGNYNTDIYAYDAAGNQSSGRTGIIYIDRTAPVIESAEVIQVDSQGYVVQIKASDNYKIDRVQCPTWTVNKESGNQDDLASEWWTNTSVKAVDKGNGIYQFRVDISDHNNEYGKYRTHIYVYDSCGNCLLCNSLSDVVIAKGVQPKTIQKYEKSLLSVFEENMTWDRINALVSQMNSTLATIPDVNKQEVLFELMQNHYQPYFYVGGYQTSIGADWQWQTGETFGYSNWGSGEPNCTNNNEFYIGVSRKSGQWNDFTANASNIGFIVETPLDMEATTTIETDNKIYKFYNASLPYNLAKQFCEENGGYLVCINSAEENSLIANKVKALNYRYFIGGNDVDEEGTFCWVSGEDFEYTNWGDTEPNDTSLNGGEDYVEMLGNGLWNDCEGQYTGRGFIAEFDKTECTHNYTSEITTEPTYTTTDQTVIQEITTEQTVKEADSKDLPTVGTQKTISSAVYKITKSTASQKEVTFVKPTSSKKTSITIPSTVTIDGYTYKVTEIAPKAFKNNKKLKSVTIGKNVKKIGKEAFYNCKNLKKITIKSSVLKSVGKNAIKNINKKATIKVPKKQLKAYKKLFKSKTGYKKTMKIKK